MGLNMKQSHNQKGEYVYIFPPNGINDNESKVLEWINEKAKEGYYFSGSVPIVNGLTRAVFWKPEK